MLESSPGFLTRYFCGALCFFFFKRVQPNVHQKIRVVSEDSEDGDKSGSFTETYKTKLNSGSRWLKVR